MKVAPWVAWLGVIGGIGLGLFGVNAVPVWQASPTEQAWANRSSAAGDVQALSHNAFVAVVGGGRQSTGSLSDVWRLDTAAFAVRTTPAAPWGQRYDHQLVAFDNKTWILGGINATTTLALNDVWSSSDQGRNWMRVGDAPWSPRASHLAVVFLNQLVVMGGYAPSLKDTYKHDVWGLMTNGTWVPYGNAVWQARANSAAAVYDGKLWVTGGQDWLGNVFREVWSTPDLKHWVKAALQGEAPVGRQGHTLSVVADRLWMVGGQPQFPGAGTVWSTDGATWRPLPANLSSVLASDRTSHLALPMGNALYLAGGFTSAGLIDGDWWTFTPCNATCSGHGVCAFQSASSVVAQCNCTAGYEGATCDIIPSSTPSPTATSSATASPSASPSPSLSASPSPTPSVSVIVHDPATPFSSWLTSRAWHTAVFALGCAVTLTVLCVCLFIRTQPKRQSELDSMFSVSERFGADWIIKRGDLRYDEHNPIGAGGFAQVYKGKYQGHVVAVKVIHAHLLQTQDRKILYTERFIDEAEMMSKLHHPNLQCLLGLTMDPLLALVTEFAPYGSLSDVIRVPFPTADGAQSPVAPGAASPASRRSGMRSPRFSSNRPPPSPKVAAVGVSPLLAIKIVYQISCGMQCLHTKAITHRDLNTNNVLVYCLDFPRLNVKVADFGLSRTLAPGLSTTLTGYVGSPAYIAPELLSERAKYDEKADVYSFGILLWSMAQYLYLSAHPEQNLTADQHRFLMKPYGDWVPLTVLKNVVDGGRPTPPPPSFPHSTLFLDLMIRCWDDTPTARPSFEAINAHLLATYPVLSASEDALADDLMVLDGGGSVGGGGSPSTGGGGGGGGAGAGAGIGMLLPPRARPTSKTPGSPAAASFSTGRGSTAVGGTTPLLAAQMELEDEQVDASPDGRSFGGPLDISLSGTNTDSGFWSRDTDSWTADYSQSGYRPPTK